MHPAKMDQSLYNSAIPSARRPLAVWLSKLFSIVLLASAGAADEPTRLPPVDPVSFDTVASDTRRQNRAPAVSLANALSDDPEPPDIPEPELIEMAPQPLRVWFEDIAVGYDGGFVIASGEHLDLNTSDAPFVMRINGWGQLRHTVLDSKGANKDVNQFQLKRGRLVFSGSAFTSDFRYFIQLDGRSSAGDDFRLLDYFLTFDFGRHLWGLQRDTIGLMTGKYKMPFTMARYLSGREFEFADRSMASMFFDVNRSFAWGLYGKPNHGCMPLHWETAIFNGLVTGGAETGSSGALDNNFAYSARIFAYPTGDWGLGELADFDWHDTLATRIGAAYANSTINRIGRTEFDSLRVVDSGSRLSGLLPDSVEEYNVNIYAINASCKFRGCSATIEYYFRNVDGFQGAAIPDLFDHGFWLQLGKFIVPARFQLLARWSRVQGKSGTLGAMDLSAEEVAGGFVWYFRDQHARFTLDVTYLDGAPINSSALDISPGERGLLVRSQIQFAF